ncbi:MAG: outer membrane beta-barrel protein [Bacteroidales bacterium]|nr:outer membrane beta-barrel protein [Bacteroidales bacterium]
MSNSMRKYIWTIILSLCFALTARAQIFVGNENIFTGRLSSIRVKIIDSLTNEPISYASVYVVPVKDTTITNFIISDTSGVATLKDVPFGNYVFHIEMMGYVHYAKEKYFREERVDMGTVKLKLDDNYLSAITVSGVGNPIVMKQDTIEFNASSFRVGANAMLKDLIKMMPGMEITEEGKVKFNGEAISKLTVGGRTFFFDDQATALNNLPAAIVEKIRVIDRESEQTRATGIQDGNREKILDVGLKKEYEQGWFGNASIKGGTTIEGKKSDEPLRDNRGALYYANALVAAYNEKDQVTVIANGMNIDASDNTMRVAFISDGERTSSEPGLTSAAQFGINVNTSRIKDVETTLAGNFKYTDTESGAQSYRKTFQENGNLLTSSQNSGRGFSNDAGVNLEMRKEKGKVWLSFVPRFKFTKSDSYSNGSSETYREESLINQSENHSRNHSLTRYASLSTGFTLREIGGKQDRSLHFNIFGTVNNSDGNSDESSIFKTAAGEDNRTMHYVSNSDTYYTLGLLRYTEPFSEKLTLSAQTQLTINESKSIRDAFDAGGKNSYYSSVSKNHNIIQQYDLTTQYKWNKQSWVTFGVTANGTLNQLISQSFTVLDTTGKGEWNWYVAPTLRLQLSKGSDRFNLHLSGSSQKPGNSRMLPVLNISNPSSLRLGNIYLKPYTNTNISANYNRNNRARFTNLMVYGSFSFNTKTITSALWYDSDGILYSIPVNSKDPYYSGWIDVNYTTPLDSKKIWSLSLSASGNYSFSSSYQATGTLPALDRETFDYTAFMADFWGDSKGNRFYGGLSGFKKSKTRLFIPDASFKIRCNQKQYTFSAGASTEARISRYSLDNSVNTNTLSTSFFAEGTYTTKHEFEFISDISYVCYKGYAKGYGKPEWQWNAEISKNIGAFNLSVKVRDILNQTRNLRHTVTANYEEDTYRLVMGRYILFGVKWNFGKMNAANSQRAQKAAWNMIF